jgi:hypothetical protein
MDKEVFASRVARVDASVEAHTLASNAIPLAEHVVKKHRLVNRGFASAGLALVLFLGVGVSYVVRLV